MRPGSMAVGGSGRRVFAPCYRLPAMAAPAPTYDLVLLLDPAATDDQRAKIVADAEAMISRAGELVSKHEWGLRPMAYEIRHKGEAEYHLLQFRGTADLLADLHRTLRITDGITRFRIIKLAPGTPAPPAQRPAVPAEPAATVAPAPAPASS
jgi:small subunit ribosomal protein S6